VSEPEAAPAFDPAGSFEAPCELLVGAGTRVQAAAAVTSGRRPRA
jgi:hypothetical protein